MVRDMASPRPKPQTFRDLIGLWPDMSVLALDLGLPYTTVSTWKARSSIHSRHWAAVIRSAQKHGIAGVDQALLMRLAAAPSVTARSRGTG